MTTPERTPDGRHIVVDGRRWRATDPAIPDPLRTELVSELMAARRAVKGATIDADEADARRRVHDAKVALGERGPKWWEPVDDEGLRSRIDSSIRSMLRKREPESSVCPSDIARIMGGENWRDRLDAVRTAAADMARAGTVEIREGGRPVPPGTVPSGPIRLGRGARFDDLDG